MLAAVPMRTLSAAFVRRFLLVLWFLVKVAYNDSRMTNSKHESEINVNTAAN